MDQPQAHSPGGEHQPPTVAHLDHVHVRAMVKSKKVYLVLNELKQEEMSRKTGTIRLGGTVALEIFGGAPAARGKDQQGLRGIDFGRLKGGERRGADARRDEGKSMEIAYFDGA